MKPARQKPDLLAEHTLEHFRDLVLGWPLLCRTGMVRFIREHQTERACRDAIAFKRDDWFLFPDIHTALGQSALGTPSLMAHPFGQPHAATNSFAAKLAQRIQEPDGLAFGTRALAALMTKSWQRSNHAHHHDDDPQTPKDRRKPIEGHDLPDAYRLLLIDHLGKALKDHPAVAPFLVSPPKETSDFLQRPDIQKAQKEFARPAQRGLQTALPILIACLTAETAEARKNPLSLPLVAWHEARQASIVRDVLIQNNKDRKTSHQRPLITAWHWAAGGVITAAAMLHLSGMPNPLSTPNRAPGPPANDTTLTERSELVERAGLWGGTMPLSAFYAMSQQWDDAPALMRRMQVPGGLLMGHLTTEMALAIGNVTHAASTGKDTNPFKITAAVADAYSDFALDVLSDIYLTAQMTRLGMATARLLRKRRNGLPESVHEGLDRADYAGIGLGVAFAFGGLAAVDGIVLETMDKAMPWLLPGVVGGLYGLAATDLARQAVVKTGKEIREKQHSTPQDWLHRIQVSGQKLIQNYGLAVSTLCLTACTGLGGLLGFAQPAGAPVMPFDLAQNTTTAQITPGTLKTAAPMVQQAKADETRNIRVKPGNNMWSLLEQHLPHMQKQEASQHQIGNIVARMRQHSNVDLIYPNENVRLKTTDQGVEITFRRQTLHVNQDGQVIKAAQIHKSESTPDQNKTPCYAPNLRCE